ncbi:HD-GYP domain-containing protein [Cohnella rhizosphaerae]|uniref:HD-GYP domain-containing protein n=1 Tax=Cohnella rhizosphaerae TaxID=1457232 RepID=A0A9X4KUA1_9BACL|nr:HD-GYP domain-containing protein [Cohnella rhizosphaerae]MDG0811221.1 HD-GYP domain-containing protein [Cohnella rhizosphaerae]
MNPTAAFVGKRLNKSIYNHYGVLLYPENTKLTTEQLFILEQQKIMLQEDDVDGLNSQAHYVVSRAVAEIKQFFADCRRSDTIALDHLEHDILPLLSEAIDHAQISLLLEELQVADDPTYRHSIAVALLSMLLGRWLHLEEPELRLLMSAAVLHDIGKSKLPLELLNKPGKLTEREFEVVQKHTVYGYEMIQRTKGLTDTHAAVALQHHERWDGSGYPHGIAGNKMHVLSRIVAVADVFHAMSSRRPYKDALPFCEVMTELHQSAFGKFDALIINVFMKRMMETLIGSHVLLSNQIEATILQINTDDLVNPLVRTAGGQFLDLSKDCSVNVVKLLPSATSLVPDSRSVAKRRMPGD